MVSALGLYYGSLGVLGLGFSLISLTIIYRQKASFKSPLGLCLANLASNQLGIVCFGYATFVMPSQLARHWIWGSTICFLFGTLKQYFQLVVFHAVFLLTLEHYLRLQGIGKTFYNHASFFKFTILTWVSSGIWAISPFLGWGNYIQKEYTCELSMELGKSGESWFEISFPFFQAFFTFLVPTGVMFHLLAASSSKQQRSIRNPLTSQHKATAQITKITVILAIYAFLLYFLLLLLSFLDWILVYTPEDASHLIFPLELYHSAISQAIIFISPIWYFVFVPCVQFDACTQPDLKELESREKARKSEEERLPPLIRNYIAVQCKNTGKEMLGENEDAIHVLPEAERSFIV